MREAIGEGQKLLRHWNSNLQVFAKSFAIAASLTRAISKIARKVAWRQHSNQVLPFEALLNTN